MVLYGIFGHKPTLYRMIPKDGGEQTVENFRSSTFIREDVSAGVMSSIVKINTMDFFKPEPNETLYQSILEFIKMSGPKGIDTLYYSFKLALDYIVTDNHANIIDGGVRYIQTDAEPVNVLLDVNPINFSLPYRKAQRISKKFEIVRPVKSGYSVMQQKPDVITFKINAIRLYANITDNTSRYYVSNLGPSSQDITYRPGSVNVAAIEKNSICLFDSMMYDIEFPQQNLGYIPGTIYVDVEMLLNQFCAVTDETEINRTLMHSYTTVVDYPNPPGHDFHEYWSPFDPVVSRPPCPGNRPVPPDPRFFPKPGTPGCRPPYPPNHEGRINGVPVSAVGRDIPLNPGNAWNPDKSAVPLYGPIYNQQHGDFNEDEWVMASKGELGAYLVIPDEPTDYPFDENTMVRYSVVRPFVTDVKIGDYVKKSDVLYY